MANIKTVLHAYFFDVSKSEERAAYDAMLETIRAQGIIEAWRTDLTAGYAANPAAWEFDKRIGALDADCPIELETKHLFNNQWNSAPMPGFDTGARLFNWAENKYLNRDIRAGYWLDQTAEMREVLRNTHKCGYCGAQEPAQKGYVFCPHCIDSEFLKESHVMKGITRMVPVCDTGKPCKPLTHAEAMHILPQYRDAQKHGATVRGKARLEKARADIERDYARSVEKATIKRDAARWIIANIPGALSNWIYYDHTGVHCFGWRNPLTEDEASALLDVISEFPFRYELRCADGRKLSN